MIVFLILPIKQSPLFQLAARGTGTTTDPTTLQGATKGPSKGATTTPQGVTSSEGVTKGPSKGTTTTLHTMRQVTTRNSTPAGWAVAAEGTTENSSHSTMATVGVPIKLFTEV